MISLSFSLISPLAFDFAYWSNKTKQQSNSTLAWHHTEKYPGKKGQSAFLPEDDM
jgi:hypothetical protein